MLLPNTTTVPYLPSLEGDISVGVTCEESCNAETGVKISVLHKTTS